MTDEETETQKDETMFPRQLVGKMKYALNNTEVNTNLVKCVCQLSINTFVLSWET